MHRHKIRARAHKSFDIGLGVLNHQMHMDGQVYQRPQRRDDQRPDGDVGDKVTVHHVHMQEISAGRLRCLHLLAQTTKVRREDRGRNADGPSAHQPSAIPVN